MKTSRTAIVTYQMCPRKYYWQFRHDGTGIEPRRQAVPLVWGQGLHAGVASLLFGNDVDEAVRESLNAYAEQCKERDFDIDDLESQSFVYAEGKALIEGFIRAWAIERLPDFMGTYEVLEVEKEGLWQRWAGSECATCNGIGGEPELDNACPDCDGLGEHVVDLAYRPDALLRKRNTNELYVFNLKSSYAWTKRELQASRYNVQGLSEMAALENRLGEKIAGIQDEIFIKGSRQQQKDETYIQATFLVHPWLKSGITSDDDEWGWQYYFEKNGRRTSLGNSYSRVNIWEHMTMREWIEMLADRKVQDSNGLSELFVTPIPHLRNAAELGEWLVQAQAQERRIEQQLRSLTPESLDEHFPMYRHSCFNYQRTCPYAAICHDRLDPDCGLYVPRVDHHAEINNAD